MKNQTQLLARFLLGLVTLQLQLATVFAQTTAFTYQGRLADGGNYASGIYTFRFTLFDAPTGGTALAGPLTNALTSVNDGLLTVLLDFGADVFTGADRWLEIGVCTNGMVEPFTVLAPRQLITPAPLALAARNAATAATVTTVPLSALPASVPRLDTNSLLSFVGNLTLGQTPMPLPLREGFEWAVPPTGWTTGGTVGWSRATIYSSEGAAAAVSGNINNSQTSYLELIHHFPSSCTLEFDWKVSSEARWDVLQFVIDGTIQTNISGQVDWTTVALAISAGTHTLRWEYTKDSSISSYSDCGWIDNVRAGNGVLDGILAVEGRVGIGTNDPAQLLHLVARIGYGDGMRIDSALPGYTPAIYLNHTGPGGRNFGIASYCDNVNLGSFAIRDYTASVDRLRIDESGTVNLLNNANVSGNLGVTGNLGVGRSSPTRRLEVSGVIGVMDSTPTLNAGIRTESGSQMINIGINDGPANRFGGTYTADWPGGFLRVDARQSYPLFGFFARLQGSSSEVTQVASISNNGTVTATSFNPTSDRNLKDNFQPLDSRKVLEKVAALPLSEWAFKQDPGVRHAGPMAQDFHAAFGLGTDDKHIATVDADGVALAAIQGLNAKLEDELQEKETTIRALQARLARVEALLERLPGIARQGTMGSVLEK